MIRMRRAGILLSVAVLVSSLFLLRLTFLHRASWRITVSQAVGLGDLVDEEDEYDDEKKWSGLGPESSQASAMTTDPSSPGFGPGPTKPPGSNYTRHLIVPKLKEDDTGWLDEEDLGAEITKMIYVADDPSAPLHPPQNKGHEVMIYLTYIIDHYDDLPDVSIFMHSHRYAWHNNDLLNFDAAEMIKRLSSERVQREGYMNLRCHWIPGCPNWMHPGVMEADVNKQEETVLAQAWAEIFPDRPIPEVLAQPCCAQFALSRARIRATAREQYQFYREWLMRTDLDDQISGRVFEYLWQVIFTGDSIFCPRQWGCYCDGYGVCFETDKAFDHWFELRWKKKTVEDELRDWETKAAKVEEYRREGQLQGIEAGEISVPEVGKDIELSRQIKELEAELESRRLEAIERGVDPKIRAASSGRTWETGEGY